MLVDVGPENTVPDTPVIVMFPEPNAIVRAFVLLELNNPVVSVYPFKFNVPAVSVHVRAAPEVSAFSSCQLPPTPLKVNGLSKTTAAVLIVFVPDVAANVNTPEPAPTVMFVEALRSP